ncbi:hypothetical protein ACHHYP_20423 [Achlya hypogyna]|uniref:RING-type domain-containing protein n=1 Tax=Achlya hypogyna TaxID=1202772 RepID=A0A1V9ZIY2_ACHHY|nr:hypothetical protein ACHHYP_20423 [Achlya hypogyna]
MCPIRLVDVKPTETLTALHGLHQLPRGCIASWLAQDQSCPMCKSGGLAGKPSPRTPLTQAR